MQRWSTFKMCVSVINEPLTQNLHFRWVCCLLEWTEGDKWHYWWLLGVPKIITSEPNIQQHHNSGLFVVLFTDVAAYKQQSNRTFVTRCSGLGRKILRIVLNMHIISVTSTPLNCASKYEKLTVEYLVWDSTQQQSQRLKSCESLTWQSSSLRRLYTNSVFFLCCNNHSGH